LFQFTFKNMFGLNITGKTSEQQADKASNKLADAMLLAVKFAGMAVLILAVAKALHWLRW